MITIHVIRIVICRCIFLGSRHCCRSGRGRGRRLIIVVITPLDRKSVV